MQVHSNGENVCTPGSAEPQTLFGFRATFVSDSYRNSGYAFTHARPSGLAAQAYASLDNVASAVRAANQKRVLPGETRVTPPPAVQCEKSLSASNGTSSRRM